MELYERLGFKSENDYNRFVTEFGDAWGMTLIMMDPAYGNILAKEFNITRPTFDSIDKYKGFISQVGLIPTPIVPPHSENVNNEQENKHE